MSEPVIHAVLIDDNTEDIQQFAELAKLPKSVQLVRLHARKSAGAEPFPALMEYLTNPKNIINLLFCDIQLDEERESDPVGIELIQRLETYYKGRLPFGIAFVTKFEGLFAANMLVEMVSPTTLCGFVVKWEMPQPARSFEAMIDRVLKNFRNKFSNRLQGWENLDTERYNWFYNGYLEDYLNTIYRVDTIDGQRLNLPISQIIGFQRLEGRDAKTLLYYQSEDKDKLVSVAVDYRFEDICTSLADLDFRPSNTLENETGERKKQWQQGRKDQPVVFARIASKYLVNLQHSTWFQASGALRPNGDVEYARGHGTWLQTSLRLENGEVLQVETHRDCTWGRQFLVNWFVDLGR